MKATPVVVEWKFAKKNPKSPITEPAKLAGGIAKINGKPIKAKSAKPHAYFPAAPARGNGIESEAVIKHAEEAAVKAVKDSKATKEAATQTWQAVEGKPHTFDAYFIELVDAKSAKATGFVTYKDVEFDLRTFVESVAPDGGTVYTKEFPNLPHTLIVYI